MSALKDHYLEVYNSLPDEVKRMTELMAYACDTVDYYVMSNMIESIGISKGESMKFLQSLPKYHQVFTKNYHYYFGEQKYALTPVFSLCVLLHMEDENRKMGAEYLNLFRSPGEQRLGFEIRDHLLSFYHSHRPYYCPKRYFKPSQYIRDLLEAALFLEEFNGLEKAIPTERLYEWMTNRYYVYCNTLEMPAYLPAWNTRFPAALDEDDPLKPAMKNLMAYTSLLLPGKLQETSQIADTTTYEGNYLKGMYHLYQGDYALALEYFNEGIQKEKRFRGLIMPSFPLFNYGYALALILEGSHRSKKKITAYYKARLMHEDKRNALACLLFAMVKGDGEIKAKNIWLDNCSALQDPMQKWLFEAIARHYGLEAPYLRSNHTALAEQIRKTGWNLLLLEGLASCSDRGEEYRQLCEQTGTTALLSRVRVLPEWEKTIELLLSESENTKQGYRIIYMVNPQGRKIQPILQVLQGKGMWSKGRKVTLDQLKAETIKGMNETDKRVGKRFSGSLGKHLNYEEILAELIGYPLVFLEGTNSLIPVEIVENKPELTLRQTSEGYEITTNIDDCGKPVSMTIETMTRLKITRLSSEQSKILGTLKCMAKYPPEARDKLLTLIKYLNRIITVHSDLGNTGNQFRQIAGDSRVVVQLLPAGEGLRAECFVKPFGTTPPYCKIGKGARQVTGIVGDENGMATRDPESEQANLKELLPLIRPLADRGHADETYFIDQIENCLELLEVLQSHPEIVVAEWPQGVRYRVRQEVSFHQLRLSLTGIDYWFKIEGELETGNNESIALRQLLEELPKSKGRFIPIGENEYLVLSEAFKKRLDELKAATTIDKDGIHVPQLASPLLTEWVKEGVRLETDRYFQELQNKIREAEEMKIVPPHLLQAELREYQRKGFEWMVRLNAWGAGGCLADDMGLGKTVQTIAMMLYIARQGASLVVCPASLLPNWTKEINRFAPALRVFALNQDTDREKTIREAGEYDVVIVTYGLLVSEGNKLAGKSWQMAVLDEAHMIKNSDTKMSESAMKLKARFRLLLTGTPIQNHLGEIWNLFQFINPGLLGSAHHFMENYIVPITQYKDKERQSQLKRLLSPFLLRRTKLAVLDELPPKTEILKEIELSAPEQDAYELLRRQAEKTVKEAGPGDRFRAMAEITRLRRAACNINLVNPELPMKAAKLEAFMEIVYELQENGHRALVFSQFTSHLALIRDELDSHKIPYLYLDGSVSIREREKLVHSFQTGEEPLFLISLKAGGLGLNLTAADFVIHMDPWWNPAIEDQASDRAYRIGQQRPVTVYRLIAQGTIEEKIIRLHRTKKDLADSLLEGADLAARLTQEEILELLQNV